MTSLDTIKLIDIITNQLNDFFAQISAHHYQFQNTTETKKTEAEERAKMLKKAYRIFKKQYNKQQISEDMSEKQRQRYFLSQWNVLSEGQKLKYLDTSRKVQKKSKKKKVDEDFKPNQ